MKTTRLLSLASLLTLVAGVYSYAAAPAASKLEPLMRIAVVGSQNGSYNLQINADSQGDLVSFEFSGGLSGSAPTAPKNIPLSAFTGGQTASGLMQFPIAGHEINILWLKAESGFSAKDGGILDITYISSWWFIKFSKSIFKVDLRRVGAKWVAEDPNHMAKDGAPAVIKSATVNVKGTTSGSGTLVPNY